MSLLEERISMNEDRIGNMVAYSRGMVEVPATYGHDGVASKFPPAGKNTDGEEIYQDGKHVGVQ